MPGDRSPVGAHVFVAGGLAKTGLAYARSIGAEALQVFVNNPRGWALAAGDRKQDELFVNGCAGDALPVYVHAPYLINLGSPSELTLERSIATLAHSLERGRAICARGVVVHAGSYVDSGRYADALRQLREFLLPLLDTLTDDSPDLLIELTAGAAASLASAPAALPAYLDALGNHPKVGVCIDTCHAMAAGHDLSAPGAMTAFVGAVAAAAGPGRLRLVHANDSKDAAGSGRDRHQSIGLGTIGEAAFAELFGHPELRGVPVLIETAGEAADHRRDLATLKRLRGRR
ncbi:MAG: deoxyribonuclease [Frankiaceae bacterium]|nr:deoxyribonuclease [Frankiaceae bacterium]